MLAVIPAGRSFFPRHGLDVGAVQRGCRPEAVEHDADRAAITARANNDPFPAGEIWASRRAERAHPDAGRWRQHGPLFGRLRRRSRRSESHCGIHLSFPFIVLASRRGRVFADREPPIAPLADRRGARRFDRGQQCGVDFRHPPELGHALGNRDETIRLIRLQPRGRPRRVLRRVRRPVGPQRVPRQAGK